MPRRKKPVSHRRLDYGLMPDKAWTTLEFDKDYWAAFRTLCHQRGYTRSYALRQFMKSEVDKARKTGELA